MTDISKIFLDSGLPGVTDHYEKEKDELKKQLLQNNKSCFRKFALVTIVYIAIYCNNYKSQQDYEDQAKETIAEGLKDASKVNDSLVYYINEQLLLQSEKSKSKKKRKKKTQTQN
mgnify:CR=1 FL=1